MESTYLGGPHRQLARNSGFVADRRFEDFQNDADQGRQRR